MDSIKLKNILKRKSKSNDNEQEDPNFRDKEYLKKNKVPSKNAFYTAKNVIANYVKSDTFKNRLLKMNERESNEDERMAMDAVIYQNGKLDRKKAIEDLRKGKTERNSGFRVFDRLNNIMDTKIATSGNESEYEGEYRPKSQTVVVPKNTLESIIYHELGHSATIGKGNGTYGDTMPYDFFGSDIDRSTKNKGKFNRDEVEMMNRLSESHDRGSFDEHYLNSKDPNLLAKENNIASETYGDLTALRHLLYKNKITKDFGEDIDSKKIKKALENDKIKNEPSFKRMMMRFGPNKTVILNNHIAKSDDKTSNDI